MQKTTGKTIVDCHDKYGHKVKSLEKNGFISAFDTATEWEKENEGNTAVILKILYNSVCKKDKWSYHGKNK